MDIYIIKSSICLFIFMAFYKLFLERTSMHQFKRFYLLGVIFISIGIPFITFINYIEPQSVLAEIGTITGSEILNSIETQKNLLPTILWSIYGLGVLLFSVKFGYNLIQIISKIRKNPKLKTNSFISVLLKDLIVPHTFFSYIFFNKTKFENKEIPNEVLLHEELHAKQKHSFDIIFMELIQIVFWFNPLVYLLKKDIKLNHEFLADQAVINKGIQPSNYQKILLAFSSNASEPQLANAINYSSIKKRFTVMKTQTSKKVIWLKSLVLLPLLAFLIYSFSTTEIVEKELAENTEISTPKNATPKELSEYNALAKQYNKQPEESRVVKLKDLQRLEFIYKKMSARQKETAEAFPNCPPIPQEIATAKQVAEYNKLAKHYNHSLSKKDFVIKLSDMKRLKAIYTIMSDEQKENAEPFPNFPPPPPPEKAPKAEKVKRLSDLPHPPPPPVPENATPEQKKKYEEMVATYMASRAKYAEKQKIRASAMKEKVVKRELEKEDRVKERDARVRVAEGRLEKSKSRLIKHEADLKERESKMVKRGDLSDIPPPPPPKSPLDHVIDMAKKGAIFYFEGKKITSDEAIALLKENESLNISSNTNDGVPIVKISTKGIKINP